MGIEEALTRNKINWEKVEANPENRAVILTTFSLGGTASDIATILSERLAQPISDLAVFGRIKASDNDRTTYLARLQNAGNIAPEVVERVRTEIIRHLKAQPRGFWRYEPESRAIAISLIEKEVSPSDIARVLSNHLQMTVAPTDVHAFLRRGKDVALKELHTGAKELPTPLSGEKLAAGVVTATSLLESTRAELKRGPLYEKASWLWGNASVRACVAELLEQKSKLQDEGYSARTISLDAIAESIKLLLDLPQSVKNIKGTLDDNLRRSPEIVLGEAGLREVRQRTFIERLRHGLSEEDQTEARPIANRIVTLYKDVHLQRGRQTKARVALAQMDRMSERAQKRSQSGALGRFLTTIRAKRTVSLPLVTIQTARLLVGESDDKQPLMGNGLIITLHEASKRPVDQSERTEREKAGAFIKELETQLQEEMHDLEQGFPTGLQQALQEAGQRVERIILRREFFGAAGGTKQRKYEIVDQAFTPQRKSSTVKK